MLPYADRVIALDKGAVVSDGPYQKILAQKPEIAAKAMTLRNQQLIASDDEHSEAEPNRLKKQVTKTSISRPEEAQVINEQDLLRRDGSWDVYMYYIKSAGYKTTGLFIFSILVTGFFSNFASKFDLSNLCSCCSLRENSC